MNNESYDLRNKKEKELFLKQLDVLLESSQHGNLVKDIHIYQEDIYTTLEWETVPIERDWGGKFVFLDEDEAIMKEVRFPDEHCEYVFPEEVEEKQKKWHEEHPEWVLTSYGTWTNVEENRKAAIEREFEEWTNKKATPEDNSYTESVFNNYGGIGLAVPDILDAVTSVKKDVLRRTEFVVMSDNAYALLSGQFFIDKSHIAKDENPIEINLSEHGEPEMHTIWVYCTDYLKDNAIYYIADTSHLIHKVLLGGSI